MTNPMPRRNPHIPRIPTQSNRKGVRGCQEDSSSPQLDCTENAGEPICFRRFCPLVPAMTVQVEDKIRVTPRRWPDFVVQGQHKQYLTVVNAVLREHGHAQRKYELVLI